MRHQIALAQQRLTADPGQQPRHRRADLRSEVAAEAIVDVADQIAGLQPLADLEPRHEPAGVLGDHREALARTEGVNVLLGLREPDADQHAGAFEEIHQRSEQALAVHRLETPGMARLDHESAATALPPGVGERRRQRRRDRTLDHRRQAEPARRVPLHVGRLEQAHLRQLLEVDVRAV